MSSKSSSIPLGFKNEKEFRDATRKIAQLDRQGTIFFRGSSVTGASKKTGKSFGIHSDIDTAIITNKTELLNQVDNRGFPIKGTKLSKVEMQYGKTIKEVRGQGKEDKRSGIRFFDEIPDKEGEYIVRPHTPESERESEKFTFKPILQQKSSPQTSELGQPKKSQILAPTPVRLSTTKKEFPELKTNDQSSKNLVTTPEQSTILVKPKPTTVVSKSVQTSGNQRTTTLSESEWPSLSKLKK